MHAKTLERQLVLASAIACQAVYSVSSCLLVPVRDRLYKVLERAEVCRDRSWIAERVSDPEAFLAYQSQLQKRLKASSQGILSSCNLAELHAPAEEFAQEALQPLVELPQLLFTAPNAEHWSLPTSMWHVDVPRLGGAGRPDLQYLRIGFYSPSEMLTKPKSSSA